MLRLSSSKRNYLTNPSRQKIIRLIYQNNSISRPEIGSRLGLRQASINEYIKELIEKGLVRVGGQSKEKHRGRQSYLLEVNPEFGYLVGIHIRDTEIVAITTDLRGKIIAKEVRKTDINSKEDLMEETLKVFKAVSTSTHVNKEKLIGIGLSIPGLVDSDTKRCIYYSHFPWWRDIPLGDFLTKETNLPCFLNNEVRAETLAEKWFGKAWDVNNFLYFVAENGAAVGIVVNGDIYCGSGGASEWGHTTIAKDGPKCSCGNIGCLETFLTNEYLYQRIKELSAQKGNISSLKEIIASNRLPAFSTLLDFCKKGDEVLNKVMDELMYHIGIGVVNLVNTFDPALIIISGEYSQLGTKLLDKVIETVRLRAFGNLGTHVEIRLSQMDQLLCGAMGAAVLVLENTFKVK